MLASKWHRIKWKAQQKKKATNIPGIKIRLEREYNEKCTSLYAAGPDLYPWLHIPGLLSHTKSDS